MAWAHTLLNITLYPVEPKPSWLDGIAAEPNTTKTKTKAWLHEDFPEIAAALPQTLISYANLFDSAVKELLPRVAWENRQDMDRKAVADVLEALHIFASEHRTNLVKFHPKVVAFAELVQKSSTSMATHAKK